MRLLRSVYAWLFIRARPRVTPGIRAEVTIILEESGHVGVYFGKVDPEENVSHVFGLMLMRFLAALSQRGVTLDFTTDDGRVIPLVRPVTR